MASSAPDLEYKDYYAVLGVPRTASQAEIKKAFRKLARQHHPDAKPGDTAAERRFKEVNEANEVLGDPEKRKQYDELGANWEAISRARAAGAGGAGGFGGPFAGFGGQGGNVRYEFHTTGDPGEFSDFFRVFFGGDTSGEAFGTADGPRRGTRPTGGPGFEEILAGMGLGQAGRTGPATPRPLPTAEAHAEISLAEAFHGTRRVVEVEGKRLEVTIPPGADTGTRLRLSGKAPGGGDLFVVVKLLPDARFTRRGADLERELPLTLEEALLGAEVRVETLKGSVLLKIPAGTQTGRTFRLTGQGMPRFRATGNGDLYVKAKVILPTNLSDEARAAAKRFTDLVKQPDPR
jgi:curved DNA-binding protein